MKVAIIIPTYNRPEYLSKCLESLKQTFLEKGTLIYFIDDCSTNKDTIELIKNFKIEKCVTEKVFKDKNKGINDSLLIAYNYCFDNDYEYVILLGSDVIVNNYFYDMMIYYKKLFPDNIISGFNTLTISELGKPRHPIIFDGGFYVKKYTNCSACSGIDKKIYNKYFKYTLEELYKKNKLCYDTLSSKKSSNDGYNVVCTVPSVSEHIGLHSSLGHSNNPDISIDFRNNIQLFKEKETKKIITFNLATYPPRKNYLKQVIENLLSINIIDKIRVYLNEYDYVPDFLINDKIEYEIGRENLLDTGKFYWSYNYKDEYYFTSDDDLSVTEDYILKHIELLEKYNGEIFVSLHGKILKSKPDNFRDFTQSYHCLEKVINNDWVNLPGTGVMVFDNSKYKFFPELFKYNGMCDLWIALYCQKNNIPCIVRKHEKNELTLIYNGNDTLWNKQNQLKDSHKEILNSVKNWKVIKNK